MTPSAFDWLENYAGFSAVVKSKNQEAGANLLLFSNQPTTPPSENHLQHFLTDFRYGEN